MKKILILGLLQCLVPLIGQDITWQTTPQTISTSGVNASAPQVGVDANGNAVAAWIENGFIVSSNYQSGSWASSPTTISLTNQSSSPQLAVDNAGNATLIWVENNVINAASQQFGGSWVLDSNNPISGSAGSSVTSSPCISIDLVSGHVAAAWLLTSSGSAVVQATSKPQLGSWATSTGISSAGALSPSISISGVFNSNQLIMAVWHAFDTTTSANRIYTANQLNGGTWSSAQAITDGTYQAAYPKVSLDSQGNAVAAWFAYTIENPTTGFQYSNVYVEAVTQPYQGTWTSPILLSFKGVTNPALLPLEVRTDMNRNTAVFWGISIDGSTYTYGAVAYQFNVGWGNIKRTTMGNLYAFSGDLALNPTGNLFMIYMQQDAMTQLPSIYSQPSDIYAYRLGGNPSIVPTKLSQGTNNGYPKASSNGSSTIYAAAVWLQSNSGVTQLQATTGSGASYPPPSGVKVSQSSVSFGIFQEYTNTLQWTASPNLNTTQYLIFRNGSVIAIVPATTLQFILNNQPQSGAGPVEYGVAAIDNLGSQSMTATVTFP